jgi:cysteine desulfurase/selenocysteine lyase
VDVQDIGCDFYAFSGHKMFGPTGIGVLYGRMERLEPLPPYQGGGDMILSVTMEKITYNRVPHRFEAGTPDLAGAVGLAAAIRYLEELGMANIAAHDQSLMAYATQALESVPDLRLVGTAREKTGVLSFLLGDIHPHDVGTILDREGICIRTGHHCAQPVMQFFKVPATSRASLALYNTREDVDALVRGLHKVREMFK